MSMAEQIQPVLEHATAAKLWPPFWLLALTPAILLFSTIAGIVAAFLAYRNAKRQKQSDTILEVIKSEQSPEYMKLHATFLKYSEETLSDLHSPKTAEQRHDRAEVLAYLNHYEIVGMCIKKRFLDGDIYRDWMGGSVIKHWEKAQEFIERERKIRGHEYGVTSNTRLFCNFEWLATEFKQHFQNPGA